MEDGYSWSKHNECDHNNRAFVLSILQSHKDHALRLGMAVILYVIARFISFASLEHFLLFHLQIIHLQLHYIFYCALAI